jgi:surfeit locus 1 family protein
MKMRWLPVLLGVLLVLGTVALGNWQLRRAAEKQTLQAAMDALASAPAIDLATASITGAVVQPWQPWQPIRLRGQWLAADAIFIDNRTHGGQAGYHLLMPLHLTDGAGVVLVNRGWLAVGSDRRQLPTVPTPAGEVEVLGRVQVPEPAPFTLAAAGQVVAGALWQFIDLPRYAAQAAGGRGLPLCATTGAVRADAQPCLAPFIVQQSAAASDGLVRDWPQPAAGVDRHHGYAFQWFALASLAAGLTGWYAWRVFLRRPHDDRNPHLA